MVNLRDRAGTIAIAVLLVAAPALAQWTLQVQMPNVYPTPYTSDWEQLPGIVNITVQYTGTEASVVQVQSHAVSVEHGDLAAGNSDSIVFSGPQTVHKDNRDFWSYHHITYDAQYRDKILQTGRLLEGTYDLYVKLIRVGTNESLAGGKVRFYILSFSAPSLIAPPNHDTVQVSFPAFMWSPATTHPGFMTYYGFRVCEMLPNQTPEQAINNIPLYSTTVMNATTTIYPNAAPPLENGKGYAWRVQARDKNNIPIGDNDGKSPVFEFRVKTAVPPPPPPPPNPLPPTLAGEESIDSLLLQSGVAYIKDFSGQMTPDGSDYDLNGTATMHIIALGGSEVTSCAVTNLKITFNQSSPFNSTLKSGTVDRAVQNGTLFSWRNNFIGVTHVRFNGGQADPVTIDAQVNLSKVGLALTANGLALAATGIKPATQATAQEFNRWGTDFAVSSMTVGDSASVSYAVLGGTLKLKLGSSEQNLGPFSGMGFNSNGSIHGSFDINNFALIPGTSYLRLTKCLFTVNNGTDCLEFDGLCGGLPSPMDKLLSGDKTFSFQLDANGNVKANAALINEFSSRGKGNDASEFNIPGVNIALDLTWLGVDWKTGPGGGWCPGLTMAMDIYFPTTQGDKRVSAGDMQNGQVVNGIQIDNTGSLNWPSIDLSPMGNSSLLIGDLLEVPFTALSLVTNSPLAIHFSGPLSLDVSGVSGGVQVDDCTLDLDGNIAFPSNLSQAQFTIAGVFSAAIANIKWSSTPTTLTFKKDMTTGSGSSRDFSQGDTSVDVNSYFMMSGIDIFVADGSIASGKAQQFLCYTTPSTKRVTLTAAHLDMFEMAIDAAFDYTGSALTCAGELKLPTGYGGAAVGKIGKVNGETSFGLFMAAKGLHLPVFPGVFLDDVGGGFFYNPDPQDIELVKDRCGLSQALSGTIKAPDPGAVALLVYGAVSVIDQNVVNGRGLLTLTAGYMEINAEVDVLQAAQIMHGSADLVVAWVPTAYAEGSMKFDVDVLGLAGGDGSANFYVYSEDVWGVLGSGSIKVASQTASAECFVGNPGLMVSGHYGYDLDLYIVSGSLDMDAMLWYKTKTSAFGAYAAMSAEGDVLGGLVGASFGLEAALIHDSSYTVIYGVGSLDVEVCYVTVFSGSVWVSVGSNGLDGGLGSCDEYDQAIEDARAMASQMNKEKNKTKDALAEAKYALYALTDEQRATAGEKLVEPVGWDNYIANRDLYVGEWNWWDPDTLNTYMKGIKFDIFNPTAETLAVMRSRLITRAGDVQNSMGIVDTAQRKVDARLAQYQALLTEQLPTVKSLGAHGTPLKGIQTQLVTLGSKTFTVRTGFVLDDNKVAQQQNDVKDIKSGNEKYLAQLQHIAWVIDDKLKTLDDLLYVPDQGSDCMSEACSLYSETYRKVVDYYWETGRYLDRHGQNATWHYLGFSDTMYEYYGAYGCSSIVRQSLSAVIPFQKMSQPYQYERVNGWALKRRDILRKLLGDPEFGSEPPSDTYALWDRWVRYGMELWYYIPKKGYKLVSDASSARKLALRSSYFASTNDYSPKWGDFTHSLDRVHDRKAEMYELLYDLYDQLERLAGTTPIESLQVRRGYQPNLRPGTDRRYTPGSHWPYRHVKYAKPGPGRYYASNNHWYPMRRAPIQFPKRTTKDLAKLLTVPKITQLDGKYVSNESTPESFGRLDLAYKAWHPVGVVDYGVGRLMPFGPAPDPGDYIWRTAGRRTNFSYPFVEYLEDTTNLPGVYDIYVRARGAGGYATWRKGQVTVGYAKQTWYQVQDVPPGYPACDYDWTVFDNSLNTKDSTPPSTPSVTLDTLISATNEIYAKWGSGDAESGIQEYRYALGRRLSRNPSVHAALDTLVRWKSAGGQTELNIRGLSLADGEHYRLLVIAINGAGLKSEVGFSDFVVDASPPTRPSIVKFTQLGDLLGVWRTARDPQSGVLGYTYSIGTSPMGSDLGGIEQPTTDTVTLGGPGGPYAHGKRYYLTVKAFNTLGNSSYDTASTVYQDMTPPQPFSVSASMIGKVSFTHTKAIDKQSGISGYEIELLCLSQGQSPIPDWNPMPDPTYSLTVAQQSRLVKGREYSVRVRARNGAGWYAYAKKDFTY
jgi:hypothetical protein